jgi:autotransporter-associated beta strand protein
LHGSNRLDFSPTKEINLLLPTRKKTAGIFLRPAATTLLLCALSGLASAQTLTITNGVQIYTALTNTAVTMSSRCDLRVTATNNPLPGSTVNLNSSNAWFFLPNIKPSVVSANYLSQIFVNGAAAVAGNNCQLTEYAMGSVIIPQAPGIAPLQVFSAPNFLGAAAQLSLWTYYTNTALGAMNRNIASFTLKRGYMATFAQNVDGTGASQVYVAQDSDLAVGVMATNLEHQCSFVRVFPWRYTGKKGWGGGDGATDIALPLWWYDWGTSATATADREYIPMKWTTSSGTANIFSQQNSAHVLGYNEPDNSGQANLTVAQAMGNWPTMMQWGLRVGAPAVSDSGATGAGINWLYSFMAQATSVGYRVDFIPIHYYKCGWTTSQFSNYLASIYQTTGKPVWVTEWNDGASWCSSGLPGSQEADATAIASDIAMLDSAPFVERYAIYEWFDPSTYLNLITTNATPTLTPAGVVYANQQSAMACTQTLPSGGSRSIAQFEFETNTLDTSGYGNNGFAIGNPTYTAGHTGLAVALDGTNNFIRLPPNIANSSNFTFAAWVYWNGGANWQRIFDFGDDTSHYLFLTPNYGSGLRFAINNGGGEQQLNAAPIAAGTWVHVAVTLNGSSAALYTNGVLAASSSAFTISPANITPSLNYLGKSQFPADPLFSGDLDEVQIADSAFTTAQIAALMTDTPPQFTTNFIAAGVATQNQFFSNSIAGTATGTGTLTYSKASGPAWLTIATNGTLTGTPGFNDVGTNVFTARVTDAAGASAFAVVTFALPNNIFSAGTWNTDNSGNWSDTTKWSSSIAADGAGSTADFSTLNISANRSVTLDASRSIGTLKFGDTSGAQNWTLIASNGSVLTLDTASLSMPSIVVNQNTVTNLAPLAGWNGFTKSAAGTLILATNNPLLGTLNVGTYSTTANDGAVRLASPGAVANVLSPINIANNNSGSCSLQLDGTAGNITVSQDIALNGRNASVVSIENMAGTNTLAGALTINVGGANYWIQSDAGLLTLGGNISSAATGSRTFTFQGSGNLTISGTLADGSATNSATKSGAGTLTFLGANTYSGITTISGGTLQVGNGGASGALGTNNVVDNAALIYNLSASVTAPNTISGSGSLAKLGSGTLTFSNANSYSGGTTLSQGVIQANSNSAFGTGAITNDSGANTARIILGNGVTIANALTANSVNAGTGLGFISVAENTSATYSGPANFNANATAGGHFAGPPTSGLLTISGPVTGGPTNVLLVRLGNVRFSGGGSYPELQIRANTTSLGANNGVATNAAVDLAGNGSPTTPTALDLNGFTQTLGGLKNFVTPANVAWVTNSAVTLKTLTLNLGTTNFSFGGSIVGPVALALNSGTQTLAKSGSSALNGLFAYTGNTLLNGGTLVLGSGMTLPNTPVISVGSGAVLNVSASGLTLGSAQTLTGNGTVLGNLTVNGTLIPGGGIGILTCSNNMNLQPGSTTAMQINKSLGTNSQLICAGALTLGGTLTVTNLGGALTADNSFKLFSAANFTGNFSALNLPPLGAGLAWNISAVTNGILVVGLGAVAPQFSQVSLAGTNLLMSGSGGAAGYFYSVLAATNLFTPFTNWSLISTGLFDGNGNFIFSNGINPRSAQQFYEIQIH